MFRIIILSGVELGFEVLRHQVVEVLGHTLFFSNRPGHDFRPDRDRDRDRD